MDVSRRQFLETIVGVAASGCGVRNGKPAIPVESTEANNLADRLSQELLEEVLKLKDTNYKKGDVSIVVVDDPFWYHTGENGKSDGHYKKSVQIRSPELEVEMGVLEYYDNKNVYHLGINGRGIRQVKATLSNPNPDFRFNGWNSRPYKDASINDYAQGLRLTLDFLRHNPSQKRFYRIFR